MEETRNKEISDEELGQLQVALVLLLCVRDSRQRGEDGETRAEVAGTVYVLMKRKRLAAAISLYKRQKFNLKRTQQNITICPDEKLSLRTD